MTELELSAKMSAGEALQILVCFPKNIPGRVAVALNVFYTSLSTVQNLHSEEGAWGGLMSTGGLQEPTELWGMDQDR